jgi:hypothetical protein
MNLIFVILLLSFKPIVPQNICYQTNNEVVNDSIKYSLDQCFNQYSPDKVVKTSNGYQYWFVPQNFMEDGLTVKMSVVGPSKAMQAMENSNIWLSESIQKPNSEAPFDDAIILYISGTLLWLSDHGIFLNIQQ